MRQTYFVLKRFTRSGDVESVVLIIFSLLTNVMLDRHLRSLTGEGLGLKNRSGRDL